MKTFIFSACWIPLSVSGAVDYLRIRFADGCWRVWMAGHLSITEAIIQWLERFMSYGNLGSPLLFRFLHLRIYEKTCRKLKRWKRCQCKEYTKRTLIRNVFMSGNILCHFPVCFGFYSLSPVCLLMQNKQRACFCAREHPENSTNLTCLFSYFLKQTCKCLCVD